jgi:hypothetical protein
MTPPPWQVHGPWSLHPAHRPSAPLSMTPAKPSPVIPAGHSTQSQICDPCGLTPAVYPTWFPLCDPCSPPDRPSPVIPAAHTVVEPLAVVIKARHTLVAGTAVFGFLASEGKEGGMVCRPKCASWALVSIPVLSSGGPQFSWLCAMVTGCLAGLHLETERPVRWDKDHPGHSSLR